MPWVAIWGVSLMGLGALRRVTVAIAMVQVFVVTATQGSNDPWRPTGLPFSIAAQLLAPDRCLQNPKWFALCMESYYDLLHVVNPLASFEVSADPLSWSWEKNNFSSRLLENWGPIRVVETERLPLPSADLISSRNGASAQKNRSRNWSNLYSYFLNLQKPWRVEHWHGRNQGLSGKGVLADLLLWAQLDLVTPENESYLSSRVINFFLSHSTDPYAHIYPRVRFREEIKTDDEEFVGLGMVFKPWGNTAVVERIDPGSPAARADIQVGDLLRRVDKIVLKSGTVQHALAALKGKAGTRVEIELYRNRGSLVFNLTREKIRLPNVQMEFRDHGDVRTAIIRVGSFLKAQTCHKIRSLIRRADAEKVEGIILDLRGNPGGLVSQGVCVAGLFLPQNKRVVVSHEIQTGESEVYVSQQSENTSIPLALLVDEDSASSAEIVAGALQDHGRALLVGKRTYGKGTFQRGTALLQLDSVLLFKTIAHFELPSGRMNQLVGIEPDVDIAKLGSKESFKLSRLNFAPPKAYADNNLMPSLKTCEEVPWIRQQLVGIRPDETEAEAEARLICHIRAHSLPPARQLAFQTGPRAKSK